MHSSSRSWHGRDGMRKFLAWAHDGVRECPRLRRYTQSDAVVFADIDMDFHATKHRPDFPFAELFPGDSLTARFFARYDLDADDRISTLATMFWPAGHGVTTLPKLGGHPSQVAAYHAYAAAFSLGDSARFRKFYVDDVVLELPSAPLMQSAQAIVDFYDAMFRTVRETLTIHELDASDERIIVDCTSRFAAIADAPDFVVGPLAKGDHVDVPVRVTYDLRDGLIAHIGVARAGEPRFNRSG